MSEHTPGPWEVWDHRGHPTRDRFRDPITADTSKWTGPRLGPSHFGVRLPSGRLISAPTIEDARLIAAAPDLLKAVRELLTLFDVEPGTTYHAADDMRIIGDAEDVIAKATGKETA